MQYQCANEVFPLKTEASLPASLTRWADALRDRGLADLAALIVGGLQVWGFVGGQLLWMAAPLVGESTVAPLAQTLEDPQALDDLQAYISKGAAR